MRACARACVFICGSLLASTVPNHLTERKSSSFDRGTASLRQPYSTRPLATLDAAAVAESWLLVEIPSVLLFEEFRSIAERGNRLGSPRVILQTCELCVVQLSRAPVCLYPSDRMFLNT